MARFEPNARSRLLTSPITALAAILVVSVALATAPADKTQPLRNAWREVLRPGQQLLSASGEWLQAVREKVRGTSPVQADEGTWQVAELTDRIQRLELELLLERNRRESEPFNSPSNTTGSFESEVSLAGYAVPAQAEPLLISQSIPARVLGRQAKAFLVERDILDVGKSQSIRRESLVVETAEMLDRASVVDQGRTADVEPHRLVLAGRRVWGRIAAVGPRTSTVRRVNDAGYRDLVQLASLQGDRLKFSARGMLVGSGQRLCKIDLVETTQPVTVGDLVFTADDGVLETPLLYGRVAKLERKPGVAHWEIWMEPAIATSAPPSQVSVLRMEINPARAVR